MQKQYAFYVDSSACSGCKTCQLACKDKNELTGGRLWRRVYEISGGEWAKEGSLWISEAVAYNLSIACNHCSNPLCLEFCPAGAISKTEEGIVLIDPAECVGCRTCERRCPYGAPQFDIASGIMTKCDFCVDLLEERKAPACVAACPMRALGFGFLSELSERHPGEPDVYPLVNRSVTGPSLVIKAHRHAEKAEKIKAEIANREEVNRIL